jgi:hypothetical protein
MLNTNTTGVTIGVGNTHTTGTPEFTLGFKLFGFPDCFTLSVPDVYQKRVIRIKLEPF